MAGFDDQRLTVSCLSQVADIGNHLAALLAEQGDDVGPHELACIRHYDAFALEPSGHGFSPTELIGSRFWPAEALSWSLKPEAFPRAQSDKNGSGSQTPVGGPASP